MKFQKCIAFLLFVIIAHTTFACAPVPATLEPTPAAPTRVQAQSTPTTVRGTPAAVIASKDVIKIATMSPLSGEQAQLGEGLKLGAQLAIKQLAMPLTDAGLKVELVSQDDQARVDTGTARAKALVTDPDVLVVIGPLNSDVAIAASDVFKDADLAMIAPASTHPKLTARGNPVVHRISGRDDMQGPAAAHFAIESLSAKKIYALHDKTSVGQANAEAFRDEAKKIGVTLVGFEGTDERVNFDAVIAPIKAATPDLVYFTGAYLQAGNLARQLREKGVNAIFVATERIDNPEFPRLAGNAATNVYYETMWTPTTSYPDAGQFVRDFKSEFNKDAPPYSAQAFDSTGVALRAIASLAKDGKPTRKTVSQAIRATKDYKGITGTYSFNSSGDPLASKYFFIKVTNSNPQQWEQNSIFKGIDLALPPP